MLTPKQTEDVLQDDKVLTLNKKEWENFEKELKNPKLLTRELKELMAKNIVFFNTTPSIR